jgi:hypothetical protein
VTLRPTAALLLLSLGACRREADAVDGTAIILVMDGVRLEESLGDEPSSATGEYPQAFMPSTWSSLLPEGARASQAWSLGATTTTPAHAVLISGRRQPLANYSVGGDVGLYRPELPSLFEAVRDQLEASEEQVILVANTELVHPVERSLWPDAAGAGWVWVGQEDDPAVPSHDDRAVLAELKAQLEAQPTRLALVNLHQVDRSGHYGNDEAYLDDVRGLDDPIAELWTWLQTRVDYVGDTTLVLISDHGRHSYSDDDPHWRHHGDNCNGCRRVPALVLGPGVSAGVDLADPLLLADVAPTLAAQLGVELPWADGLVLEGLLEQPSGAPSRSGLAGVALAGGLVAELRYQDDPNHRSALWIEGQQLSDPDALQVEAPTLARSGEKAWLCFRELLLTPGEPDTAWQARCFASDDGGDSWQTMAPPVDTVGPMWQAALVAGADGKLLAGWVNNLNATATGGAEGEQGEVSLELGRYDGGWTVASLDGDHTFPTDPTMTVSGESLLFAIGAAPEGSEARHTRDVYLGQASLDAQGPHWVGAEPAGLSDLAPQGERWRLEHPALRVDSAGTVYLAAVGHSDAGSHAVLASSQDQGQSWSTSTIVEMPHPVAPHLSPVWLGERAVWVAVDTGAGDAYLCAAGLGGEASCVSVASPRVLQVAVDGDDLYAIVDAGVGEWVLEGFEIQG